MIFPLAFFVRLYRLNQVPARFLVPTRDWELGAIAISLMEKGSFADPYLVPSGPTAHLPPVFPFLISIIYRRLGLTYTAGYVSWLMVITFGSLLFTLLPHFSTKLGVGKEAGLLGAIIGALWIQWPGHGEYLTAVILGVLTVIFLRRWTENHVTSRGSFLLGLLVGTAFHLQPVLLPVIACCIIFELWWSKNRHTLAPQGLLILGIVLALLPWAWRNYQTFSAVFFVRSNLGLELRMGNHEGAAATMAVMDALAEPRHPRTHTSEARRLRDIGEIEYMREAQREALDWIRKNPREFLWLTLQRFANVWAGPLHRPITAAGTFLLTLLALWGLRHSWPALSVPQRAAVIIPLVTYPLIYYLVAYMPRYRIPIDWILFILAGASLWYLLTYNGFNDVAYEKLA